MTNWLEFWNGTHRIYVNDRHREVHYRNIAQDLAALLPGPDAVVVDYGPGEALSADRVAERCRSLVLCEAAEETRARLRLRFGTLPKIRVLGPADLSGEPDRSVDLFLVNSVVQYLSPAELDGLLATARRLLAPSGRLLLADVIPPHAGLVSDTGALLSLAAHERFLLPALGGLFATFFSPYRKIRNELGLARFTEEAMLARLRQAGFKAERHRPNLGHNQARMAFLASPQASSRP